MHGIKQLSMRWKLQLGFFGIAVVVTLFHYLLTASEMQSMIDLAQHSGVPDAVKKALINSRSDYQTAALWQTPIEWVVLFIASGVVAKFALQPIQTLSDALRTVDQGNLTQALPAQSDDEFGKLQSLVNSIIGKLSRILGTIEDSGREVGQSAFQIATIASETAEAGRQEDVRSAEAVAEVQALTQLAHTVQEQSAAAAALTRHIRSKGQEAVSTVERNIAEMEATVGEVNRISGEVGELSDAATEINRIIDSIKAVAEQTSLLALNAAIEAARAGEQGRGFAVVADEVRKLSDRTAQSSTEIATIIATINSHIAKLRGTMESVVAHVHDSQTVAGETAGVMADMAAGVSDAAHGNDAIVEASQRQMEQLARMEATLERLFVTLKESATKVETTASIGNSLRRVSEQTLGLLAGLRFERQVEAVAKQHGDKRRHPRMERSVLTTLRQDSNPPFKGEALISDLSLSGVCLTLPQKLQSDLPVTIEIQLPATSLDHYRKQKPIPVQGIIRWQREEGGRPMCGLEFQHLNASQRERIAEVFAFYNETATYTH